MDELNQLIVELEKPGRSFGSYETGWGQSFLVVFSKGRLDGKDGTKLLVYPCDTAIFIKVENPKQPHRSKYAIFSTFICEELSCNSLQKAYDYFNSRNYTSLGKFVRDDRDGSNDVLYVTSQFISCQLTSDIVSAHLDHHAIVKMSVLIDLKKRKYLR